MGNLFSKKKRRCNKKPILYSDDLNHPYRQYESKKGEDALKMHPKISRLIYPPSPIPERRKTPIPLAHTQRNPITHDHSRLSKPKYDPPAIPKTTKHTSTILTPIKTITSM